MEAHVRLTGNVGGDIDYRKPTDTKGAWATFRVAVTPRYRGQDGEWVDLTTTWLTVNCRRRLAYHVKSSLGTGDAVVVVGRLRTHTWVDKDGQPREQIQIEADTVAHDLNLGKSAWVRSPNQERAEESNPAGTNRGGNDPWNPDTATPEPGDAETGEVDPDELNTDGFAEQFGTAEERELAAAAS